MTTHYEKIQALGNRMASNLETMGVSASFGDGGLTLADKILQIQHFTDGLLLYADKSIIQIDDTVNVYALLLDERKAVSGETILFNGLETTQTLVVNTETSVGNQYRFTNLPSSSSDWGDGKVYLNEEQTVYLRYSTYGFDLITPTTQNTISSNISIENGIITCYGAQTGTKITVDISSTNTSKITSTISDVTIAETLYAITGSDGVATVSYTGKGAGVLNIKAVRGIIQSETFSLLDCIKYDNATFSDHNDIWSVTGTTLERGSEYSIIEETSSSTAYVRTNIPNQVTIEIELLQTDGLIGNFPIVFVNDDNTSRGGFSLNHLQSSLNTWVRIKIELSSTQAVITNLDNGVTVTRSISNTDVSKIQIGTLNEITKIYFRNFKAY